MQNKVNYQATMDSIVYRYGPFHQNEIDLYINTIMTDESGNPIINGFQKSLVFDMFYKYFRDVQSIRAVNRIDLAILFITAKKILSSKNMKILPYIVSGKVEKLVSRKNVNKRELLMIESSPTYPKILEKYKNPNIIKHIRSIVASVISSDFSIVDMDPDIHGLRIDIVPAIVIEEILIYVLIC